MTDRKLIIYSAVLKPGDPLPPGWYRKAWALNEDPHGKGALNITFVCTPEQHAEWLVTLKDVREILDLVGA